MFQMAYSQSIRKDYYEMTTVEREEYVRVMNKLYSDGVVSDFVSTHANSNFVRHAHPEFLPWHRIMLYYFERQAKVENKYLNLGYMNWFPTNGIALRSDNLLFSNGRTPAKTIFDPLAAGWIGLLGYSSNWNFTRFNNSSNTVSIANVFGDLQSIVNENTFENVRRVIETGNHNDQLVWIGGSFGTMAFVAISPRDPTFYFHHSMTDYAWQRWLAEKWIFGDYGNIISTSQPSVNNQPLYNPQSIFDNRTVKLWYATEGTVKLKNYTVTNQTLGVSTGPEFYFYTGKIEVATTMGEYFTVPSG